MSAEIDEYPSLRFQDIRKKPASLTDTRTDGQTDGQTDNLKTVYPRQTKFVGGINIFGYWYYISKFCFYPHAFSKKAMGIL